MASHTLKLKIEDVFQLPVQIAESGIKYTL